MLLTLDLSSTCTQKYDCKLHTKVCWIEENGGRHEKKFRGEPRKELRRAPGNSGPAPDRQCWGDHNCGSRITCPGSGKELNLWWDLCAIDVHEPIRRTCAPPCVEICFRDTATVSPFSSEQEPLSSDTMPNTFSQHLPGTSLPDTSSSCELVLPFPFANRAFRHLPCSPQFPCSPRVSVPLVRAPIKLFLQLWLIWVLEFD